jgi:hypothetical protein
MNLLITQSPLLPHTCKAPYKHKYQNIGSYNFACQFGKADAKCIQDFGGKT